MTKKELNYICKSIRDKYNNKEKISKDDENWLIENIFRFHPQWGWWRKQGIEFITVGVNPDKFFTRCFYIHFTNPIDKKSADISWNKAISNIK